MKNCSIQGLRGLFALGVLLSHCFFLENFAQSSVIFNLGFQKLANVSFFFMVSGFFLMSSKSVDVKFGDFLKKKLFRIYPLHMFCLLVLIVNSVLFNSFELSIFNIIKTLANFLLIQTWIPSLSIATSYNTVSWFLSSLFFCYIIGYWIVMFIKRGNKKSWTYIYILTLILMVYKVVIAIIYPTDNFGYYLCYLTPIAGLADFLIGIIIFNAIKNIHFLNLYIQISALILLILSLVLKYFLPVNFCRAFVMLPANCLLIIAFSKETKFSRCLLGNKILMFLGDISFEIYLMHVLIISRLNDLSIFVNISNNISPFVTLLILICICIVCAVIYKNVFNSIVAFLNRKISIKKFNVKA